MGFLDDLDLKPGTTTYSTLPVGYSALGPFELPITIVNGARPGPTVSITAGVHGPEYTGVAACVGLGRELDPRTMAGRLVMLPIVNLRSFELRTSGLNPLDGMNINRVFPGQRYGSMTEQMAYVLFHEIILRSDAYLDLHGSGLYQALPPHVGCQRVGAAEVDERSEALARLFEIELVNVMGKGIDEFEITDEESGVSFVGINNDLTAVGNAALAGVPAVLLEVGRGGSLEPELVQMEMRGIVNVLRYLGMLDGQADTDISHTKCYGMYIARTRYGGLFFPSIRQGDVVKRGDILGEMQDVRGEVLATLRSPIDALILMLDTSPAKASGEKLLDFATLDEPPSLRA